MLPIILAIIPRIFDFIVSHIGTVVDDTQKSSIVQGLEGLAVNKLFGKNALTVIEGVLGPLAADKKLAIQADIDSIMGNVQLDTIEADKPGIDAREILFMGLVTIVLTHLSLAEIANIWGWYHGAAFAIMDNMTLALLGILLGGHMAAKTVENINSNQSDS